MTNNQLTKLIGAIFMSAAIASLNSGGDRNEKARLLLLIAGLVMTIIGSIKKDSKPWMK